MSTVSSLQRRGRLTHQAKGSPRVGPTATGHASTGFSKIGQREFENVGDKKEQAQ